jgi:hypothetical protein
MSRTSSSNEPPIWFGQNARPFATPTIHSQTKIKKYVDILKNFMPGIL